MEEDKEEKENTYKTTHPEEEGAKGPATSDTDMLTPLGAQAAVLLLVVLVKIWAQCTGLDSPNDGEISSSSSWRLHEAFIFAN